MKPTNRRDLLKFFGVGASIVPVISGAPLIEATAKLIEPAKVEPITSLSSDSVALLNEELSQYADSKLLTIAVMTLDPASGTKYFFSANSFIELCTPSSDARPYLAWGNKPYLAKPPSSPLRWRLEGEARPDENGIQALISTHLL